MSEIITTPQLSLPALLDELSSQDLRPSARINYLFSMLVAMSFDPDLKISEGLKDKARELAAKGEYELEVSWANRLIDGEDITQFPYFENYVSLAEHEYHALLPHALASLKWSFIGSGPLPLSQLLFEHLHGTGSFRYIDSDNTAQQLAGTVATGYGARDVSRTFVAQDARTCDYSNEDVVVVAALVGATAEEKLQILETIAVGAKPGAIIAARSVPDDSRTLLYPRLSQLPQDLEYVCETIPPEGVINSLVIMRKL